MALARRCRGATGCLLQPGGRPPCPDTTSTKLRRCPLRRRCTLAPPGSTPLRGAPPATRVGAKPGLSEACVLARALSPALSEFVRQHGRTPYPPQALPLLCTIMCPTPRARLTAPSLHPPHWCPCPRGIAMYSPRHGVASARQHLEGAPLACAHPYGPCPCTRRTPHVPRSAADHFASGNASRPPPSHGAERRPSTLLSHPTGAHRDQVAPARHPCVSRCCKPLQGCAVVRCDTPPTQPLSACATAPGRAHFMRPLSAKTSPRPHAALRNERTPACVDPPSVQPFVGASRRGASARTAQPMRLAECCQCSRAGGACQLPDGPRPPGTGASTLLAARGTHSGVSHYRPNVGAQLCTAQAALAAGARPSKLGRWQTSGVCRPACTRARARGAPPGRVLRLLV